MRGRARLTETTPDDVARYGMQALQQWQALHPSLRTVWAALAAGTVLSVSSVAVRRAVRVVNKALAQHGGRGERSRALALVRRFLTNKVALRKAERLVEGLTRATAEFAPPRSRQDMRAVLAAAYRRTPLPRIG